MGWDCMIAAKNARRSFYFDRGHNFVVADLRDTDPRIAAILLRMREGLTKDEVVYVACANIEYWAKQDNEHDRSRASVNVSIKNFVNTFPSDTFIVAEWDWPLDQADKYTDWNP